MEIKNKIKNFALKAKLTREVNAYKSFYRMLPVAKTVDDSYTFKGIIVKQYKRHGNLYILIRCNVFDFQWLEVWKMNNIDGMFYFLKEK